MRRSRGLLVFCGLLCLLVMAAPVSAVPITGLCDTGANVVGGVDQCYSMVGFSAGLPPTNVGPNPLYRVRDDVFPFPPWAGNGPGSGWIAPQSDYSILVGGYLGGDPAGYYAFRTSFYLGPLLDPATAVIAGLWSADNDGIDILVNGVSTGNVIPYESGGLYSYQGLHSFTIPQGLGFQTGLNTLDFIVYNRPYFVPFSVQSIECCNPAGLFVQDLAGTVEPIPEPAAWLLSGMGLAAVWLLRRRR